MLKSSEETRVWTSMRVETKSTFWPFLTPMDETKSTSFVIKHTKQVKSFTMINWKKKSSQKLWRNKKSTIRSYPPGKNCHFGTITIPTQKTNWILFKNKKFLEKQRFCDRELGGSEQAGNYGENEFEDRNESVKKALFCIFETSKNQL